MLTFKLRHPIQPRPVVRCQKFDGPPSWDSLAAKVAQAFFIPACDVAVAYNDEDDDPIVVSSQVELDDYYNSKSYCDCPKLGFSLHNCDDSGAIRKLTIVDLAVLRQQVQREAWSRPHASPSEHRSVAAESLRPISQQSNAYPHHAATHDSHCPSCLLADILSPHGTTDQHSTYHESLIPDNSTERGATPPPQLDDEPPKSPGTPPRESPPVTPSLDPSAGSASPDSSSPHAVFSRGVSPPARGRSPTPIALESLVESSSPNPIYWMPLEPSVSGNDDPIIRKLTPSPTRSHSSHSSQRSEPKSHHSSVRSGIASPHSAPGSPAQEPVSVPASPVPSQGSNRTRSLSRESPRSHISSPRARSLSEPRTKSPPRSTLRSGANSRSSTLASLPQPNGISHNHSPSGSAPNTRPHSRASSCHTRSHPPTRPPTSKAGIFAEGHPLLTSLADQLAAIAKDPKLKRSDMQERDVVTRAMLPEIAGLTQSIYALSIKVSSFDSDE